MIKPESGIMKMLQDPDEALSKRWPVGPRGLPASETFTGGW